MRFLRPQTTPQRLFRQISRWTVQRATGNTFAVQLSPDLEDTVHSEVLLQDAMEQAGEFVITLRTRRQARRIGLAVLVFVIRRRCDRQLTADWRDPVFTSMCVDECTQYFLRRSSSAWAESTNACAGSHWRASARRFLALIASATSDRPWPHCALGLLRLAGRLSAASRPCRHSSRRSTVLKSQSCVVVHIPLDQPHRTLSNLRRILLCLTSL